MIEINKRYFDDALRTFNFKSYFFVSTNDVKGKNKEESRTNVGSRFTNNKKERKKLKHIFLQTRRKVKNCHKSIAMFLFLFL